MVMGTMRAAIYTRANGERAERDLVECRGVVKRCRATLVEVFSDEHASRQAFERLRALVEAGGLDVVVCVSLVALVGWREVVDLVRDWNARGVRVLYDGCDSSDQLDLVGAIGALIADQRLMRAAHTQGDDDAAFEQALAERAQQV